MKPPLSPATWLAWLALLMVANPATTRATQIIESITFAIEPGNFYAPLDEALAELRWMVRRDQDGRCVEINGITIRAGSLRRFMDGKEIVSAGDLQKAGAEVAIEPAGNAVTVSHEGRSFVMFAGPKRVEISLARQQLNAWQGSRLVLRSRISSGRHGSTPAGDFKAGPYKARMHYSSLFQNAPMPWSVQIYGHVFIHGFTYVPNFPASHGCIRLPLDGINPARFFYEWVDNDCPVRVTKS